MFLPKRKSVRLDGFDYSSNGMYFITICTQNRKNIFWNNMVGADRCVRPCMESQHRPCMESPNPCVDPCMESPNNDIGKLIDYWWNELPNHFSSVKLDDYVIMPNHIHGIIIINDSVGRMGDDSVGRMGDDSVGRMGDDSVGRTHRSAPTIGNVIQWFKTMVTNEYIRNVKLKKWPIFVNRLFQRNYYEEIIKNKKQYLRIKKYIKNNPDNLK